MNQKKINGIIIDWKLKRITPEEAMQRIHKENNVLVEGVPKSDEVRRK